MAVNVGWKILFFCNDVFKKRGFLLLFAIMQ